MDDSKKVLERIQKHMKNMGTQFPDAMQGFQNMMKSVQKPGTLSTKVKELIGVALSVKSQCRRCIVWHVEGALSQGATRDEILEASITAMVMGGGPSLMSIEDVVNVLDDLNVQN